MCLFDTGGLEQFRTLSPNFYRESFAILLFYSSDSLYTLEHLYQWAGDATDATQKEVSEITWAVIRSKCDLVSEVAEESAQTLCREYLHTNLLFSVSAKSGEHVKSSFEAIVEAVYRKHQTKGIPLNAKSTVKLNSTVKHSKCSC